MLKKNFAGAAKAQVTDVRSVADGLRGSLKSMLVGTLALFVAGQSFGGSLPAKIKVVSEASGGLTRISVENKESTDMTATIEINAVNMDCSVPLPFTLTVPA